MKVHFLFRKKNSSIKKTYLIDITAILLKVSLITYNPNPRFCISMLLSVIKPFPDDIKELYDMKLSPGHLVAFSNECSGFITLREPCNNQQPRCDIAWFHVINHLYHGFPN
jgi:hypothetical protein